MDTRNGLPAAHPGTPRNFAPYQQPNYPRPEPPAQDTRHEFDQQGDRQLIFQSATQAKYWWDTIFEPPPIAAGQDPTISEIEMHHNAWVLRMVNAIYDLDDCKDGQKMQNHFDPAHKSYIPDIQVEAACHLLVDILIKSCREGYQGLRKNNFRAQKKCQDADKTANCRTHAENIVKALRTWKSIGKNIVEEDAKKWQLVSGPLSYIELRNSQSDANKQKAATNEAGKEARLKLYGMTKAAEAYQTQDCPIAPATPQRQVDPSTSSVVSSPDNNIVPGYMAQRHNAESHDTPSRRKQTPQLLSEQGSLGSPFTAGPHSDTSKARADIQAWNARQDSGPIFFEDDLLASYAPDSVAYSNKPIETFPVSKIHTAITARQPAMSNFPYTPTTPPPLAISNVQLTPNTPSPVYGDQQPMLTEADIAARVGPYGISLPTLLNPGMPVSVQAAWGPIPPWPGVAANNTGGGNMQSSPGYYNYNMPHYDHRHYFNYGTLQHDPSPLTASLAGTTSSMNVAPPHNTDTFSQVGEVAFSPNDIHAAHQATQTAQTPQVPQPMIHGNYPKIGTKRTREASDNFESLPPPRRQKRNADGGYWLDERMPDGNSDEEEMRNAAGGVPDGRGQYEQQRNEEEL